jgi:DNA-binding XRE family transcriptional regulator
MARTGLVISVRTLATAARVSTQTLVRLERGEPLRSSTMARIRAALEQMGAEFGSDGASVTVYQKASKKPPPDASARKRRRKR